MRIGFIGLGMMGHHMVANLQKAGHDLVVHDVRRDAGEEALSRGARWAETPADAARQTQIVMTSLPGPKEVEQVALGETGIIGGALPGTLYVDLSTSSPTLIRHIHAVLGQRGVRVADAPVSGGVIGAEEASLRGDWDRPRFALALARKDLGLATDLASEFGVPMPLAAVAEPPLIECMNRGWGGKDMTAAWALQEERAQVQVRVAPPASVT